MTDGPYTWLKDLNWTLSDEIALSWYLVFFRPRDRLYIVVIGRLASDRGKKTYTAQFLAFINELLLN